MAPLSFTIATRAESVDETSGGGEVNAGNVIRDLILGILFGMVGVLAVCVLVGFIGALGFGYETTFSLPPPGFLDHGQYVYTNLSKQVDRVLHQSLSKEKYVPPTHKKKSLSYPFPIQTTHP